MAVVRLPDKYRRSLRSTNGLERLIQEVRRRESNLHLPQRGPTHRLLGTYLAETYEEWATGRRYFEVDEYFACRAERDGRSITEAVA